MTDKQIIIDYENLCENYSKEVGCYNTFDGSCIKEQCFTYRLLQLLKAKEQEYEELKESLKVWKYSDVQHIFKINTYEQTLAEIKEIAEKSCCLQPTSDCEEYGNCKECSRTSDDATVKQIIQKISECEVRDDKSNR